jgi:hypothetical protein
MFSLHFAHKHMFFGCVDVESNGSSWVNSFEAKFLERTVVASKCTNVVAGAKGPVKSSAGTYTA